MTRCGCLAKMRVHIDTVSSWWYVSVFIDDHNHDLLSSKFFGLLRSHRKIGECNAIQLILMRDARISIPKIYGYFVTQAGGFDKVGF